MYYIIVFYYVFEVSLKRKLSLVQLAYIFAMFHMAHGLHGDRCLFVFKNYIFFRRIESKIASNFIDIKLHACNAGFWRFSESILVWICNDVIKNLNLVRFFFFL